MTYSSTPGLRMNAVAAGTTRFLPGGHTTRVKSAKA